MVLVRARVCSFPLCHFHCVNVFGGRMVVRQLNSFCFWLLRGVPLHALLSVPSLCYLVCEIAQCSRQSRSSCGKALSTVEPGDVSPSGSCPLQPWRRKGSGRALRKGSFVWVLGGACPHRTEGKGYFSYRGRARVWGTLSLLWAWPLRWPLSSTTWEQLRILASALRHSGQEGTEQLRIL